MATVAQVAKASLQRILVQDSEMTLEPAEYQDFIFSLNAFMNGLQADGLVLGWTDVSNLSDTLTVEAGALRGIIDNMAIQVAPDYGGVPQEIAGALAKNAADGMRTLEKIGVVLPCSAYPGTLPTGSGNDDSGLINDRFFEDQEAAILAGTA